VRLVDSLARLGKFEQHPDCTQRCQLVGSARRDRVHPIDALRSIGPAMECEVAKRLSVRGGVIV
jgi:hypothetical protein